MYAGFRQSNARQDGELDDISTRQHNGKSDMKKNAGFVILPKSDEIDSQETWAFKIRPQRSLYKSSNADSTCLPHSFPLQKHHAECTAYQPASGHESELNIVISTEHMDNERGPILCSVRSGPLALGAVAEIATC